jgi:hypothetical protein
MSRDMSRLKLKVDAGGDKAEAVHFPDLHVYHFDAQLTGLWINVESSMTIIQ